jgi:hypothetical protein
MTYKRLNIIDLKNNHPEKFGRFVMALKNFEESDDWYRICGIHGNTFKPNDPYVLCPTDPDVVKQLAETGETMYCKHSVYSFIAWHTPYMYQYELLLNKYNKSKNDDYITLPYIDLTDFSSDFTFMNDPNIDIIYDKRHITIDNPLASAYYYPNGVKTKTFRQGFLSPSTPIEKKQLDTIRKQLNNVLYATTYEMFSSKPVSYVKKNEITSYVPLETPHNQLHNIIGGVNGTMADVTIAAFDPIFWMHHCNMDRHFYTWLYNNTNKFKDSLSPDKMTDNTYEKSLAPFSTRYPFSTDSFSYDYGWKNNSLTFMSIKDMLNFKKYPYYYDIIIPKPEEKVKSFIELIDIPIPNVSVVIYAYLHLKTEVLNKNLNFAGSTSWFGLNRNEKSCERCNITRTNIKIDIDEYVYENKITNNNIKDYNLVIEGEGRLLSKFNLLNIINDIDLIKDGSFKIIIQ